MKRTFTTLASIVFVVWGGSNLWLAGFEQGYEQGESMAWQRANRTFTTLSKYNADNSGLTLRLQDSGELSSTPSEVKTVLEVR